MLPSHDIEIEALNFNDVTKWYILLLVELRAIFSSLARLFESYELSAEVDCYECLIIFILE